MEVLNPELHHSRSPGLGQGSTSPRNGLPLHRLASMR